MDRRCGRRGVAPCCFVTPRCARRVFPHRKHHHVDSIRLAPAPGARRQGRGEDESCRAFRRGEGGGGSAERIAGASTGGVSSSGNRAVAYHGRGWGFNRVSPGAHGWQVRGCQRRNSREVIQNEIPSGAVARRALAFPGARDLARPVDAVVLEPRGGRGGGYAVLV